MSIPRVAEIAVTFMIFAGGSAVAAPPEPNLIYVGQTSDGGLSVDMSSVHDHRGQRRSGWRRATAIMQLADPIADAGRLLPQIDQIQDWDCAGRRYRVVRKIFRTDSREYVRSEAVRTPWSQVAAEGAEAKAFAFICPSMGQDHGAEALGTVRSAEPERIRRRAGAAVIWMPASRETETTRDGVPP